MKLHDHWFISGLVHEPMAEGGGLFRREDQPATYSHIRD